MNEAPQTAVIESMPEASPAVSQVQPMQLQISQEQLDFLERNRPCTIGINSGRLTVYPEGPVRGPIPRGVGVRTVPKRARKSVPGSL